MVRSNNESKWNPEDDGEVLVTLYDAVTAVLEKSSNKTSCTSVPTGWLPVGAGIVGGISGTIVLSSITSNILVWNFGTVTICSTNLPSTSVLVNTTSLSGISIVPPCISALNVALSVFIVNFGSSNEANLLESPRLLIIAGGLPLSPVLYLYSSLKLLKSLKVSDTSCGKASFSKLPVSIKIGFPCKSERGIPSAVEYIIDSLTGDRIVLALTTSWNSVVGFLKNFIGCVFITVDKSIFKVLWYLTL